jgi:hypothetical protein
MDKIEEIKRLVALLKEGAITQEEFDSLKKNVLTSTNQQDSTASGESQNNYKSNNNTMKESDRNTSFSPTINFQKPKSNANYSAIVFAAIMAISVFLPWAELSGSASFGGYSSNYSSGGLSGINIIGYGVVGLIMAVIGGGLAITGTKWASIFGFINLFDGIGYAFGWFNAHFEANSNSTYGDYHATVGVDTKYGLYLFIISSFIFVILSLSHKSRS